MPKLTRKKKTDRSPSPALAAAFELHRQGRLDEAEVGYRDVLKDDPSERIEKWARRLPSRRKLNVAIAWAGSATHEQDHIRSIAIEKLGHLFAIPDIQWIGIQRDLRPGDEEFLAAHRQIMHVGAELADFADTAAVLSQADLTISVDTSTVHLAGALGRPVWVLLQHMPDFRWLLERDESPWYPSARLFRQPDPGDWNSVIERVSRELAGLK